MNVEDHPDATIISSSWVITEKLDLYKFRLVAGGHQQDRLLYNSNEISSPTASWHSTLLIISNSVGKDFHHYDVETAYLNAKIDEDYNPNEKEIDNIDSDLPSDNPKRNIIMKLNKISSKTYCYLLDPSGEIYIKYKDRHDCITVKLDKALYGLLQSGVLWYTNLKNNLINIGFRRSENDQCIFYMHNSILIVYVDDLLLITNSYIDKNKIEDKLESIYGKLKKSPPPVNGVKTITYVGMTIINDSKTNTIFIHQKDYIKEVLKENNEDGIAQTPCQRNLLDSIISESDNDNDNQDIEQYVSLLAKLNWIATHSRPDIKYGVSVLSTVANKPNKEHYNQLRRILRYLNATINLGLTFYNNKVVLETFTDASFMQHSNRSSHTGIIIRSSKGSAAIYSESTKQKIIAQSTFESEIIALNKGKNMSIFLRRLSDDIGAPQSRTNVYEDNAAVIDAIRLGRPNSKSRHIQMRYYSTKESIEDGSINVVAIATEEQPADMLTKPISTDSFIKHREVLLGTPVAATPHSNLYIKLYNDEG